MYNSSTYEPLYMIELKNKVFLMKDFIRGFIYQTPLKYIFVVSDPFTQSFSVQQCWE